MANLKKIDFTTSSREIYKRVPVPVFRTEVEKQRYWELETKKCIEGYSGLTGACYHYFQHQHLQQRIVGVGGGGLIVPRPRFADVMIFEAIENARKKNRMLGVFKPRGVGLSTIGGGALPNYFMKFYPGAKCLITSKDKKGIGVIFTEKLIPCYDNYHPDLRPAQVRRNESSDRYYLSVEVEYITDSGLKTAISSCELYETSERPKSATNFSGHGGNYGFYDEFPLHPRRTELLKSSIECYKDPNTKKFTGFLLWGGTCEETLSDEDVRKLKQTAADASIWDTDILFIPYWWTMFLDKNGFPNKEKAERWYEQEYEKYAKAEDPTLLKAFIRNNPARMEDLFETQTGGIFEEDVIERIKLQREEVIKSGVKTHKCTIVHATGYAFPEGKDLEILEHPVMGARYVVTIDGVQSSDKTSSAADRSALAAVVTKIYDKNTEPYMPVAIYNEIPSNLEASICKVIDLCSYYNQYNGLFKINTERNVGFGEMLLYYLTRAGMVSYAAHKKVFVSGTYRDKKEYFYYRDDIVRNNQIMLANSFLRKHIKAIQMLPLLEEMLMDSEQNTDILDAWLGLFETIPDIGMEKKVKEIVKPMKYKTIRKTENGKIRFIVSRV